MKVVGIVLFILLIALQCKLWIGDGSVSQWSQLKDKVAEQEKINDSLREQNRAIEADIVELKSGDQALEEQARYGLGMVKSGEMYYQFVE